jgi:hypothetical protein
MLGSYRAINKSQIRVCRTCGREVCFVENRFGKPYMVDVIYHPNIKGPVYKHSAGNHKNLTMWHVCRPQVDHWKQHLLGQANALLARLCQKFLVQQQKMSDAEKERFLLTMHRANIRIERRKN